MESVPFELGARAMLVSIVIGTMQDARRLRKSGWLNSRFEPSQKTILKRKMTGPEFEARFGGTHNSRPWLRAEEAENCAETLRLPEFHRMLAALGIRVKDGVEAAALAFENMGRQPRRSLHESIIGYGTESDTTDATEA